MNKLIVVILLATTANVMTFPVQAKGTQVLKTKHQGAMNSIRNIRARAKVEKSSNAVVAEHAPSNK